MRRGRRLVHVASLVAGVSLGLGCAAATNDLPTPDFKLAPGDRLGLIGDSVHVEAAETLVASFADGVRMDRGLRD